MMTRLVIPSVAIVVLCTLPAAAQVATAGFNDASGINSDGTPNSPYNVANAPLNGKGGGELGWFTPWTVSNNPAVVVNTGQDEGDGAAFFQGTAGAQRVLSTPLSGLINVSLRMKIANSATSGNGVNFYVRQQSTQAAGPNWQASGDGHFRVVDGHEDGTVTLLDTLLLWTPGAYQTIRIDVNTAKRTWDFFVNGVHYNAPHALGYRDAPTFLDQIDFFNAVGSPNGTFLDAVTISPVPEPSSMALAGLAGFVGMAVARARRRWAG